jgi:hypothetical protein
MADGSTKAIADVQVGDQVLASDPQTGEQAAKTVEHVWVHDDTLTDLVVDSQVITATEDHPFWSVTDHRFERADQLTAGEKVSAADGTTVTVTGFDAATTRTAPAYNLTVADIHTYHVGTPAILVHNTCPTGITPAAAGEGGMAGVRAAGRTGEEMAGIIKNTDRIPSASGRAAYRIPDELNPSVLGEAKNVSQFHQPTARLHGLRPGQRLDVQSVRQRFNDVLGAAEEHDRLGCYHPSPESRAMIE